MEKENRVTGAHLRNAAEFRYLDFGTIIRNEIYIQNKKKSARNLQKATWYSVSNFRAVSVFKNRYSLQVKT